MNRYLEKTSNRIIIKHENTKQQNENEGALLWSVSALSNYQKIHLSDPDKRVNLAFWFVITLWLNWLGLSYCVTKQPCKGVRDGVCVVVLDLKCVFWLTHLHCVIPVYSFYYLLSRYTYFLYIYCTLSDLHMHIYIQWLTAYMK